MYDHEIDLDLRVEACVAARSEKKIGGLVRLRPRIAPRRRPSAAPADGLLASHRIRAAIPHRSHTHLTTGNQRLIY